LNFNSIGHFGLHCYYVCSQFNIFDRNTIDFTSLERSN